LVDLKSRETVNVEFILERHEHGHSLSRIHDSHDLSWATTERWVQQRYQHRVSQRAERVAPRVLGIDEHFFSRKQGFATTFADLVMHRVFDVQLGRSELALHRFLDELPGKHATEVVLMDLSETDRAIAHRRFPNAIIVADRFHVIRVVGQALMECWKQLEPVGRKNRGLVSLVLGGDERRSLRQEVAPDAAEGWHQKRFVTLASRARAYRA
jgi:transposase